MRLSGFSWRNFPIHLGLPIFIVVPATRTISPCTISASANRGSLQRHKDRRAPLLGRRKKQDFLPILLLLIRCYVEFGNQLSLERLGRMQPRMRDSIMGTIELNAPVTLRGCLPHQPVRQLLHEPLPA